MVRPAHAPADDDPEPLPPLPPESGACCGSGCNPCVLDLYEEERQQYLQQLRAWRERRAARELAAPPRARKAAGKRTRT